MIELLKNNKALYKPCSEFEGIFEEPRAVFLCNEAMGHSGEFVYIRDDRVDQEYFSLCEVQVFPFRSKYSVSIMVLRITFIFQTIRIVDTQSNR